MDELTEFQEMLDRNIQGMDGSSVFCCLWADDMGDFKKDPIPAIQLAIAIMMDKPIMIACLKGRKPSAKLIALADVLIEGETPQELAAGIANYMRENEH